MVLIVPPRFINCGVRFPMVLQGFRMMSPPPRWSIGFRGRFRMVFLWCCKVFLSFFYIYIYIYIFGRPGGARAAQTVKMCSSLQNDEKLKFDKGIDKGATREEIRVRFPGIRPIGFQLSLCLVSYGCVRFSYGFNRPRSFCPSALWFDFLMVSIWFGIAFVWF